MLTWSHETTIPTTATAEQVWALWSRPDEWNKWDEGNEWVKLDGMFATGAKGYFKPVGGPKVKFVILEASPQRSFKDRSFLPLTHLDFIHIYTPNPGSAQGGHITHRVEMRGWLTPLFSRVIGRDIQKTLPDTLGRLSALARKIV